MTGLRRNYFVWLLLISIAGLSARLEPYVQNGPMFDPDSSRYVELANGLTSGCGFARKVGDSCTQPELFRTPGYPLLLAASRSIGLSIVLVSLFSAIVVFFVGFVLGDRWSHRAGLLAAVLLATDLSSICRSSAVLTDAFFQCFVATGLLLEVSGVWRRRPRIDLFMTGSLILSLSPLIRPIGIILWPLTWLPILVIPTFSRKNHIVVAISIAVFALLPLLIWSARNERLTKGFAFSTNGSATAYYFVGGGILAAARGTSIWEQIDKLEQELQVKDMLDSPATLNRSMLSRVIAIAAQHPKAAFEFEFFSTLRMIIAPDEAALRAWLRVDPTPHGGEPYFMHFSERLRGMLSHPGLLMLTAVQVSWLAFVWIGIGRFTVKFVRLWNEIPDSARCGIGIISDPRAFLPY